MSDRSYQSSVVDRSVINVSLINSMFCLGFCILKFTIKKKRSSQENKTHVIALWQAMKLT